VERQPHQVYLPALIRAEFSTFLAAVHGLRPYEKPCL
jgi:hypothetical protein